MSPGSWSWVPLSHCLSLCLSVDRCLTSTISSSWYCSSQTNHRVFLQSFSFNDISYKSMWISVLEMLKAPENKLTLHQTKLRVEVPIIYALKSFEPHNMCRTLTVGQSLTNPFITQKYIAHLLVFFHCNTCQNFSVWPIRPGITWVRVWLGLG